MYKEKEPYVTPKYPIEVPTHLYYTGICVYKILLGTKFYVGKCQSLPQAMTGIAVQIERAIRTRTNDSTGWFYHLIAYIIKNRVMRAKVEVLSDEKMEVWEMLKKEQTMLDAHKNDPHCLNNNFEVHITKWVDPEQLQLFKKWKDDTDKSNRNKHRAANPRKKHKGGQLAVRGVGRVSAGVRSKKGAGTPGGKARKKP